MSKQRPDGTLKKPPDWLKTAPPAYFVYMVFVIVALASIVVRSRGDAVNVDPVRWRAARDLPHNHRIDAADLTAPRRVFPADTAERTRLVGAYVAAEAGIPSDSAVRIDGVRSHPRLPDSDSAALFILPIPDVAGLAGSIDAGSRVRACTPGACVAPDLDVIAVICTADTCSAVLDVAVVDSTNAARLRAGALGDSLQLVILGANREEGT
jgi:hypothetical protein